MSPGLESLVRDVEALATDAGVEAVARALLGWVAAKTPEDKARTLLDTEYAAVRAAADAEARRELGG